MDIGVNGVDGLIRQRFSGSQRELGSLRAKTEVLDVMGLVLE